MNRSDRMSRDIAMINDFIVKGIPDDYCYFCGSKWDLQTTPFGLSRVVAVTRKWAGTAASIAANLITIPLGTFVFKRPDKQTEYMTLRLRFVVCNDCIKLHKPFAGSLPFRIRDYRKHPIYSIARKCGFREFEPPWRIDPSWTKGHFRPREDDTKKDHKGQAPN